MVGTTNTTLDLLILQLILHGPRIIDLFLCIFSPVGAGPEYDILTYAGCVRCRLDIRCQLFLPSTSIRFSTYSCGVLLRKAELRPLLPLCYSWVDDFFDCCESDAAGGFDFLALIIYSPCNDSFGTILVGSSLRGREFVGILKIFVVGPVAVAMKIIR